MKDTYAEIELQFARMIEYMSALDNSESVEELGNLHEKMLSAVNAQMDKLYEKAEEGLDAVDHIDASDVVLIVRDERGRRYTRYLPMDYSENDNGITIKGENLQGEATEIVFLSEAAVNKLTDLTGHGLDKPRCNH